MRTPQLLPLRKLRRSCSLPQSEPSRHRSPRTLRFLALNPLQTNSHGLDYRAGGLDRPGIDNVVFIAIVAGGLPEEQQGRAWKVGSPCSWRCRTFGRKKKRREMGSGRGLGKGGEGEAVLGGPELGRHFPEDLGQALVPLSVRPRGGSEEILDSAFGTHVGLQRSQRLPIVRSFNSYGRHPVPVSHPLVSSSGARTLSFLLAPRSPESESWGVPYL
jgi:hypothetical protein